MRNGVIEGQKDEQRKREKGGKERKENETEIGDLG